MFTVGFRDSYEWLVTDEDFDLLELCPEIVLGKYLAVTSIDSSQLIPTRKRRQLVGRAVRMLLTVRRSTMVKTCRVTGGTNGISSTLRPTSATAILQKTSFEVPQEPGHLSVFVNYGFALHPPERADLTLTRMFWAQMTRIQPESYVADNDDLTFVSANKTIFASVRDRVTALG